MLICLSLWTAVMMVIAPAAIVSGQVQNAAEAFNVFSGAVTSFAAALLLHPMLAHMTGKPVWYGVVFGALGICIIATVQCAGDYGAQFAVHALVGEHRMPDYSPQALLLTVTIYGSLSACNMALLYVASAAAKMQSKEFELAQSRIATLQADMKALRMQLTPHFLFNALNVISALILEDRAEEANEMTERLAALCRAMAAMEDAQIPLHREFELVEQYIAMEAARFGSRLRVQLSLDPSLRDARVPNLLMQPLVENAIKHGVERAPGAIDLRVSAYREGADLVLVVENQGERPPQAPAPPRPGLGVGLANTRARLKLLLGDEAALTTHPLPNGHRALIRLPLAGAAGVVAA